MLCSRSHSIYAKLDIVGTIVYPATDENGRGEAVELRTAQSHAHHGPQTVGQETLWLTLLGSGLQATMAWVQDG